MRILYVLVCALLVTTSAFAQAVPTSRLAVANWQVAGMTPNGSGSLSDGFELSGAQAGPSRPKSIDRRRRIDLAVCARYGGVAERLTAALAHLALR